MKNLIKKEDKILLAGHNGMAGSAILRALKKRGYRNIIYFGRDQLDLEDFRQVDTYINNEKPDVIILAAAKVGGIMANHNYPADFILRNLKIQTNLIECAWTYKVKRFLFLGSSCIYPKLSKQPIKEEYLLEGNLEKTNEFYAVAKIAGIKLCHALNKQYGFDAICLMPTNLYGPGDNYNLETAHVLPALIRKFYEAKKNNSSQVVCWGDGSPYREFLHSDDLGDAALFTLENVNKELIVNTKKGYSDFIHINVGTSEEISIRDLALLITKELKYEGEIKWDISKPNGTSKKRLDIGLLTDLGWRPSIDFKEGIKMTIADYGESLG